MAENNIKTYRNPDDPITLEELKSFLWAAATHLRGQIDAAGYKEYIFPLLFFKRISDVYDEQFDEFLHEGGVEYAGMRLSAFLMELIGAMCGRLRRMSANDL